MLLIPFCLFSYFALLRSTINDQLLTLEIISHTPILTIQGEKDVQETADAPLYKAIFSADLCNVSILDKIWTYK